MSEIVFFPENSFMRWDRLAQKTAMILAEQVRMTQELKAGVEYIAYLSDNWEWEPFSYER